MSTRNSTSISIWQQHIDEQQKSGKSRKSYCEAHGLKLHQFNYYLRSIGVTRQKSSAFSRVLVSEAGLRDPGLTATAARLVLGKGVMLEFGPGSEPEWIARIVAQVQHLS